MARASRDMPAPMSWPGRSTSPSARVFGTDAVYGWLRGSPTVSGTTNTATGDGPQNDR